MQQFRLAGKERAFPMSPPSSSNSEELLAHVGWMHSLALRLVRDVAAADDLVQDALLAALEQQPDTKRSLAPWFAGVLRRRASFLSRGHARRSDRENRAARDRAAALTAPGGDSRADDVVQRGEAHQRLVNAVMALRDPYRSVLLLRYYDDFSPREIARRKGLPPATVRSQLARALDELRNSLDSESGGDRRAWCLALLPVVADKSARTGSLGLTTFSPLLAMHVLLKIALPLTAIAIGAVLIEMIPSQAVEPELDQQTALDAEQTRALTPQRAPAPITPEQTETAALERSAERVAAAVPAPSPESSLAHIAGQLVDRDSGQAVPYFVADLYAQGQLLERVESDAHGKFETSQGYENGEYECHLIDRDDVSRGWVMRTHGIEVGAPDEMRSFVHQGGAVASIEVESRPNYRLQLLAPKHALAQEITAWLSGPDSYSGTKGATTWATQAPVRMNTEYWVRFLPCDKRFSTIDGPWTLQIESADGLWIGSTNVEAGPKGFGSLANVRLEGSCKLQVELRAHDKRTLHNPRLGLQGLEQGDAYSVEEVKDSDPSNARFALGSLAPGKYLLVARADNAFDQKLELELHAGQVTQHTIQLDVRDLDAYVRGELTSVSGQYTGKSTLLLNSTNNSLSRNTIVEWEERNGRWVAPFAFEDLPTDSYRLQIFNWKDSRHWSGQKEDLQAPLDGLVLTCEDESELRNYRFHLSVEPSSLPPDYVQLLYSIGDSKSGATPRRFQREHEISNVPTDQPLQWCLRAEGFRPIWGDAGDFPSGPQDAEAHFELEAGWGARLLAIRIEAGSEQPLAGAQIFSNGKSLGTTDSKGCLELQLESEATQFSAKHPSFPRLALTGGDLDLLTGTLSGDPMVHRLEFEAQ